MIELEGIVFSSILYRFGRECLVVPMQETVKVEVGLTFEETL